MKYTDVAATYDKLFKDNASAQIWENINDGEPLTIVKTLEHFVTSGDVLDIGAGVGHYSIYLASRGFNVLATDISAVAIERFEARAKAKGVSIHTRFHDIADQELEHEFDVIICAAVLHHLRTDDALSVINKIQDHTKPMGSKDPKTNNFIITAKRSFLGSIQNGLFRFALKATYHPER